MLTSLITGVLGFFSTFLDKIMPVYDISSSYYDNISSSMMTISDFITQANFLIPLPDIAVIITVDLAIRVFKIALFAANWIIRRIADIIP